MIRDFSDLSRKEARTILCIDNDFKYDSINKANKLIAYFDEKKVFKSMTAKRFEKKFKEYTEIGVPTAACPLCNAFKEGKGRLLCDDCISELEQISEIPQKTQKQPKSLAKPTKQTNNEPIRFEVVNGPKMAEKAVLTEKIENKLGIVDRKQFVVIPKKRFYISMVAFIALTLMLNILIAIPHIKSNNEDVEVATIESDNVPMAIMADK